MIFFETTNSFLLETTSALVLPPVAGDCQQNLLSSGCCCRVHNMFHCSTVHVFIFQLYESFSKCIKVFFMLLFFEAWTLHGVFQNLTSMFAQKLLAPKFHCSNVCSKALVLQRLITVHIQHFFISFLTPTWSVVMLQDF